MVFFNLDFWQSWQLARAGKNLGFTKNRFLGFKLQNARQNYDRQAKIRPYERHKSQFIFEYH